MADTPSKPLQSVQKLFKCKRRNSRCERHNRRTRISLSDDVRLLPFLSVSIRIHSPQTVRASLRQIHHVMTEQAIRSGYQHCDSRFNREQGAPLAIVDETPKAQVNDGRQVEVREAVEKEPAVVVICASKDHVTRGKRGLNRHVVDGRLNATKFCPETHSCYLTSHHSDLWTSVPCVAPRCPVKSTQIGLVDMISVDQQKVPDTESRQLHHQCTSGPANTNDANTQRT